MRKTMLLTAALTGLSQAAWAESMDMRVAKAEVAEPMFGASARVDVILDGNIWDAFALFTAARVGRQVFVFVENDLIMAPHLHGAITRGNITLSAGPGGFNGRSAEDLATYLNSGGTIRITDERP